MAKMDQYNGAWRERMEGVMRDDARLSHMSHPVFKAVGVRALLAAQVNEEVCGSGSVLGGHVPHDPERVTSHLANLDIAGGGQRGLHFCHLPLNRGMKESVREQSVTNTTTGDWQRLLREIKLHHKEMDKGSDTVHTSNKIQLTLYSVICVQALIHCPALFFHPHCLVLPLHDTSHPLNVLPVLSSTSIS